MSNDNLKDLENDAVGKQILQFIPNNLGINLCAVDDITIVRNVDKLVSINIDFKLDDITTDGAVAS